MINMFYLGIILSICVILAATASYFAHRQRVKAESDGYVAIDDYINELSEVNKKLRKDLNTIRKEGRLHIAVKRDLKNSIDGLLETGQDLEHHLELSHRAIAALEAEIESLKHSPPPPPPPDLTEDDLDLWEQSEAPATNDPQQRKLFTVQVLEDALNVAESDINHGNSKS